MMGAMVNANESRRLSVVLAIGAFVLTLWLVAFLWVFIGQWSLTPDEFESTREWWREFVLPRAARSLLAGVPLACLAALCVRQLVIRARRRA